MSLTALRSKDSQSRATVRRFANPGNRVLAQRGVILVTLNADVLSYVPGRHHACMRPGSGPLFNGPGPRSHLFVSEEGHRRDRVRPVAVLTAPLQDGRNVLRERHLTGRLRWFGLQCEGRDNASD